MAQPAHEHVDPAHTHTAVATPATRTWGWAGMAIRILLTLAGAAAMVVSAFMDWARGQAANDISVRGLYSTKFGHSGNNWITTLAFVMVALGGGVVALIGGFFGARTIVVASGPTAVVP